MVAQPPTGQYLQPMTQEQWQALLEQHYAGLGMAMPGPAYQTAAAGNAAMGPAPGGWGATQRGPQTQQPPPQQGQDGMGGGYMNATTTPSAPGVGAWSDPAFLAMRQQMLAQQQGMPVQEPVGGQPPGSYGGTRPPRQDDTAPPPPTRQPTAGSPPATGVADPPVQGYTPPVTTQPPPVPQPQAQPPHVYHPWRPMDLATRQYYEDVDPQAAYRQYVADMYGTQDNPQTQYATNFYQQARARYLRASEQDPNMMWVDSLSPDDLNNYIRQQFGSQTASNRGESLYYAPRGRMTSTSY